MKRILLFDVETSPLAGYAWRPYDTNLTKVFKEWGMLSFAYKWLGSSKVVCFTLKDLKSEKKVVKALWKVLNEADILVAHNGDKFDVKKVQAKFLEYGLMPTKPFETVDTLKVVKSRFALTSNRLDAVAKLLGIPGKLETGGFQLWEDCMAGNASAFKRMATYNKQDVVALEDVYLKLRPWAKNHPHVMPGVKGACPKCSSMQIKLNRCQACKGPVKVMKSGVLKNG